MATIDLDMRRDNAYTYYMVTRRRELLIGMTAAALSYGAGAPARAQTPAPVTFRLASNSNDDVTPVLWAQRTGAFAKAGIDADIQKFNAGAAVTAALAGGAIDIGKADLLPLIAARSRGIPLQLVAPSQLWLTAKPISGMVVLKESRIATGKDLNGTTLSAPGLLDLIQTSTRAWTDAHGGDSKTLKFIELPSSAALEALIGGRIAAAALSAPYFGNAVASGKVRVLCHPDDAIAKRFMLSGWFANESFIEKNHDLLVRFVQIVDQAGTYTNAHNAETLAMSAQFTGIEPAVLAGMTRAFVASSVDPKDVQPLIDAAVKYGVIAKPLDVAQLISSVALRPR